MWEIPRFRVRAYLRAQKRKSQETTPKPATKTLFARTEGQLVMMGAFGEPARIVPVRVVLNDLRPTELTLFSSSELPLGERVTFTMEHPKGFYVAGTVSYCRSFELTSRVYSTLSFPYRMKIKFEIGSDQEARLIREYCEELAATVLRGAA